MNVVWEYLLEMNVGTLLLWKVTLILLVGCVVHLALHWSHPQWRVLLWRGAWLGIVVTALATMVLPAWRMSLPNDGVRLSDERQHLSSATPAAPRSDVVTESVVSMPPSSPEPVVTPVERSRASAFSLALSLWLAVAFCLFLRWARSYVSLSTLRTRASSAPETLTCLANQMATEMGLPRKPTVLVSREVESPCSVGTRTPVILLPNAEDPDMKAILAHEMAHLRSRDPLWIWLMDWLAALLWFHPLCWLMRRNHLFACEATSDAAAVDTIRDQERYSAALARIALTVCGRKPAARATVSMARSSQIIKRLRLLNRRYQNSGLPSWKKRLSLAIALAASLIMGTLQFGLAEDEETDSPIVGIWKDDRGGWHRFAANGWYIELRGDVRTLESWQNDPANPEQWQAGLSKVERPNEDTLVMRREGVIKELRLTKATPPSVEILDQLATESQEDKADRKRLEGIWVVKGGDFTAGSGVGGYDTWVRFAPDGTYTKVHWAENGHRPLRHGVLFRLARVRGQWTMQNRLLTALGASIQWEEDQTFIAQRKSYDDSGLWDGVIRYEKRDREIPEEVRELLFAEPNEKNRRHLLGTWNRNAEGTSWITFNEDGRWRSQASGNHNGGHWEVTDKHVNLIGSRLEKILRLDDKIYEHEQVPIDKAGKANPVRKTFHKVPPQRPKDVKVEFRPTKNAFNLTEPVEVVMSVKNGGDRPFRLNKGGRQRGARDNRFSFDASQNGETLPDVGDGRHRGGRSHIVTIKPGESHEITVDLRKWFALDRPGLVRVRGYYEADHFDGGITQPLHSTPIRLSADFRVLIAPDHMVAGFNAGKTFRGIDLTKTPSTTKTKELPEIWEARPPGSSSYEIRKEVIVYPVGFEGVVYFIPTSNHYYIQSDPLGSSTMTFYGPLQGNPFEKLKLAEDLEREVLQSADPELAQRARQLLDQFVAGEHTGLKHIGKEIQVKLRKGGEVNGGRRP